MILIYENQSPPAHARNSPEPDQPSFAHPVITTQPQSSTNAAGTTSIFWVAATGTPPLTYKWQKLSGAWSDLASSTDTNLSLSYVQTSHAGDYRVVITNMDGALTSDVAHLTVIVPPRITPTVSLQNWALDLGTASSFVVTVSGTAPLSFQWRLDGRDLAGKTQNTLPHQPPTRGWRRLHGGRHQRSRRGDQRTRPALGRPAGSRVHQKQLHQPVRCSPALLLPVADELHGRAPLSVGAQFSRISGRRDDDYHANAFGIRKLPEVKGVRLLSSTGSRPDNPALAGASCR